MNLTVHQTISIRILRVDNITHSSVLQIGSAGMIRSLSNLYNTGGFFAPAIPVESAAPPEPFLVPLPPPVY